MFSKQFLIIFSISIIGSINSNTWSYVNRPYSDIPYSIRVFFKTIPALIPKVLNGNDNFESLTELTSYMHLTNLTVIVCGETLGTGAAGRSALIDYIFYEQNRYNATLTETPDVNLIQHPEDSLNFVMNITMRSSMGFYDNRTIKISAIDIEISPIRLSNYILNRFEVSGSCLDSKNINKTLIVNEWVPKSKYVDKTAKEFMKEVIGNIPFRDQHFFDNRSIIFLKGHISLTHITYFGWLRKFSRHFKHRAELYSSIISENIDHIVFRTSHVFENIKNNEKTEVWHFIIEIIFENSNWTIRQMQFRPDYSLFRNIARRREAMMIEVDVLIQEIENVAQSRSTKNWFHIMYYGNLLKFDNPELIPKYAHKTDLFAKIFKIPSAVQLEKCDKFPKDEGMNLTIIVTCKYWLHSSENQKLSRKIQLEVTGEMDRFVLIAVITGIRIIDPIKIKSSENFGYYVKGLVQSRKQEQNHNFIAKEIASLLIGQSSVEYSNWTTNFEKLEEFIDDDNFNLKICGESYKQNSAKILKKYLERNRRLTKLMIFNAEMFTKSSKSEIEFNVSYTSTNSMGFFITENYKIVAMRSFWGNWGIQSMEIEGACIYDNLNPEFIYPMENLYINEERENEIDKFIENNSNQYSKDFKGYLIANPNISETYKSQEYEKYILHFLKFNKLRNKSHPKIIINEENHVVLRIEKYFDHFLLGTNKSTNDEWIFLIEVMRNFEGFWEITKLVMSPKLEIIVNNIIPKRAANYHMMHMDQQYLEIIQKVPVIPKINETVDFNNCETQTFNHTVTEYSRFLRKILAYSKLAAPRASLNFWKKIPKNFKLDGFDFEISYEFVKNGIAKAFVVKHFAEYNFKYGYYHDVKLEITCPKAVFKPGAGILGE
ncbi:unnamed protein product [Caenorhabditis angaria]|uniref:Uncharacterized protein n=1 Tax=Caenorhabditis angaria TaxID=860376 RepID=A0A9P1I4S3_9PELO|nr:unnamed protein product [Caenorhabditis angaria]